jgi:hypothetical protein
LFLGDQAGGLALSFQNWNMRSKLWSRRRQRN